MPAPSGYDHGNKTDGQIYVEYTAVNQAAEDMRMQTERINKLVTALNEELTGLFGAWQGADASTYGEIQGQWNSAAGKLGQILANHSATLDDITDQYRRHEARTKDNWEGVRIGR
ncbi:WXG100 family type VII secretion target [Streptomyces sp. NPDC001941]|uniref:WXG100 family type VII secretion target n=1 Tax=Streptomyces sp. NPDC001941 TaxID=3154659 RepID=UPI0033260838